MSRLPFDDDPTKVPEGAEVPTVPTVPEVPKVAVRRATRRS